MAVPENLFEFICGKLFKENAYFSPFKPTEFSTEKHKIECFTKNEFFVN